MKSSIWKSRKFWIAVCDAIFTIATMVVTFYLSNQLEVRVLVLGILATLQPVFIKLIESIAVEDAAAISAGAREF